MKVEVAVVGAPFVDITFEGLERLPQVHEELVARRVHVGPGGTGMQAIGAARLGLDTALVASVGDSGIDGAVRAMLENEGVKMAPPVQGGSTGEPTLPVTALLSTPRGVAMATGLNGDEPTAEEVAAVGADAIVLSLGRHGLAPAGASVYAVTGGLELGNTDAGAFDDLRRARALVVNESEATTLTGQREAGHAALQLARTIPTVVVTRGDRGAVAARGDRLVQVAAPSVEAVDATGAGDLFVPAFVWADKHGSDLETTLRWSCLYAGLSVRTATALSGAVRLRELLDEGLARGLAPPEKVARTD